MQEISPESPEARAKRRRLSRTFQRVGPGSRAFEIMKRVAVGVYSDGFIHAGNLAYLALLTLFPFFIVTAALAQMFGRGSDTLAAVGNFLHTLPPSVAEVLKKPIIDVLEARSGSLLWLGAIVGLWTVGSFIETIRDILRRAYGTSFSRSFWHYRMGSAAMIIISVVLVLTAFSAQILITAIEEFVTRLLPFAGDVTTLIGISRLAPGVVLFGALYALFYSLTPAKYRYSNCPKWPGAMFVAVWWMLTTMALPQVLGLLGSYDLTYGSLAGVIIALIFFWVIGLGVVFGAELNAALAETPETGLKGEEAKVAETAGG